MTRTASATLIAQQKKTAYTPSISVTTRDNGLPHPKVRIPYPMTGCSGLASASCCVPTADATQGAIVRAHRVGSTGVYIQRITDPDVDSQWTTGWSLVQSGAYDPALFYDGTYLVLVYQDAGNVVKWRRSSDAGVTWSAEQTLWSHTAAFNNLHTGVSGGSSHSGLFYADGNFIRFRRYDGATDTWDAAQSYDAATTVSTIGACYDEALPLAGGGTGGGFRLAVVLEDYADWTDSALVITSLALVEGAYTWGTPSLYLGLQGGTGAMPAYSFSHAHLAKIGSGFWLTFRVLAEPTAGATFAAGDHLVAWSDDGVYFTAGIKIGESHIADRLVPLLPPSGGSGGLGGTIYLAADNALYTSDPATTVTAATAQVLSYTARHRGAGATLTISLDNRDGSLDTIHTGRLGADLVIARGVDLAGSAHTARLDTFCVNKVARSRDGRQVTLSGYSYYRLLQLWHADLTYYYTNQTIAQLVERVAALAGIHTYQDDGSTIFSTVVGSFAIQPGQSAAEALASLADQFQFVLRITDGATLEALTLSATPAAVYTFGRAAGEHPTIWPSDEATRVLPSITHAQVIGTGAAAEAIATDLQAETGRQFTHRVEHSYITTTAEAQASAAAMIDKVETSISRSVLVAMPAFHLQPFDPIDSDDWAANTVRYIAGILEVYNPTSDEAVSRRGRTWQMTLYLADYTASAGGDGSSVNIVTPENMQLTSIKRGTLISFDTTTWKGLVRFSGSASAIEMRAGEWISPDIMDGDSSVAVLLYDESNPDDGLILGPYGGAGWAGRSKLYASDGDPVALSANAAGNLTASGTLTIPTVKGPSGEDLELDDDVLITGDLTLSTGATVAEFSTDGTFEGNSDTAVPTEKAAKTYADAHSGAWVPIAKSTLAGTAASFTFSNIPGDYEALVLCVEVRSDRAAYNDIVNIRFNGDAGANYDYCRTAPRGNNTVAVSAAAAQTSGQCFNSEGASSRANCFSAGMIYMGGYATSGHERYYAVFNSGALGDRVVANMYQSFTLGGWRSTNAVTSITLISGTGNNFVAGSSFALYGIREAS